MALTHIVSDCASAEQRLPEARPDCTALLTCPVCAARLEQSGRVLVCSNRHSFDIARQGYVNLLAAGHGKSGITGDSAEMVDARRRIFARDHFAHLAERLAAIATAHNPATILDAGCGSGYYLSILHKKLRDDERCWLGTDISKEAVRRAASDYRELFFFLNDIRHRLTIRNESVDLLLNIFAPRNTAEFSRVLKPHGRLLVVIPTEQHLAELRTRFDLLDIGAEKRERTIEQLAEFFALESDEELRYHTRLLPGDVGDLLRMTPNYWHLPPEVINATETLAELEVGLAFRILQFGVVRRTGDGDAEMPG